MVRMVIIMLRVHLFGKFQIESSQAGPVWNLGGKALELLCYLLVHAHPHSREALATALWPECDPGKSRKNLRQVLWQLQCALEKSVGQAIVLGADSDSVAVRTESGIHVDVANFETAYRRARGTGGDSLTDGQAADLEQAVQLYRGDLIAGCYEAWCLVERERLQNCYLSMLEKLIAHSLKHQNYQQGIEFGQRILALDRAHERSHQQLMLLYSLLGNRTGALRQYERCKTALREELCVAPSKKSTEIYQQVRGDLPLGIERQIQAGTISDNPGVLFQLESLLDFLSNLQILVRDQIRFAQQNCVPHGDWPSRDFHPGPAARQAAKTDVPEKNGLHPPARESFGRPIYGGRNAPKVMGG